MTLLSNLENKTARIGIVGLGYVGLSLLLRFSEAGLKVPGLDIDADKVTRFNRSESVELLELLHEPGAEFSYSDPHVPVFPKMREQKFDLSSVPLTEAALKAADVVLLSTDHDKFRRHADLIVDARGVYHQCHDNVVRA